MRGPTYDPRSPESAKPPVDLRSDTVTRPTAAMLEAMRDAKVGDDVYGEDETVHALETRVAQLLGMEAALFTPSGTMANQLAIALHTTPGDSIIAEQGSHCFLYEVGGAAALSGAQFDLVPLDERLGDESLRMAFRAGDLHQPRTRLLVVENTHNRGGGRTLTTAEIGRILRTARGLGLTTHCDGARIWNAAVALDVEERELLHQSGASFDSVAVCFSKGLGAPVGSAFCGTREMVERARRLRKRWGGGMRQAGYLAACALYALDHHRQRLATDHRNAALIANALADAKLAGMPLEVSYPEPGTNMIYARLAPDRRCADRSAQMARATASGEAIARRMREAGVYVNATGQGWIRAVTHLDVDTNGIERAVTAILEAMRAEIVAS